MAGIKESTRVKLLLLHGFALLTLGMLLFYVRGTMEILPCLWMCLGNAADSIVANPPRRAGLDLHSRAGP